MPGELQKQVDSITLGTFSLGIDWSRPADEIGPSMLYSGQNLRIGTAGEPYKRLGVAPINSVALNSGAVITAIGNHRFSASSSSTYAVAGAKFYETIGGTPADRTGTATITAGADNTWNFRNADGTMVGHNGKAGDTILKWATAGGNVAALDVDSRFTWAKWVEWWDRRVWWANLSSGTNRLWYSDTDDIETYGALSFFTFDEDIEGIRRWTNGLIVHTTNTLSIILPTGNSDTPYRKIPIILGDDALGGSISGRCVTNVPRFGQLIMRRDGIYAFSGAQTLEKISNNLDGSRYWDNVNKDRLFQAFTQVYPVRSEVWFFIPYGSGQTTMNHIQILNYRLSGLSGVPVWYGPDTGWSRNCAATISDLPHAGGHDGYVYKHEVGNVDNDGTTDNGIDYFHETGMAPPFGGEIDVSWQKARHFYEVKGSHQVEITEQSPDISADTQLVQMGGEYDSIGVDFAIGISKIAGDSEMVYSELDLSGQSPFKKLRFKNANPNEPISVRRSILTFSYVGPVRRDISGVN